MNLVLKIIFAGFTFLKLKWLVLAYFGHEPHPSFISDFSVNYFKSFDPTNFQIMDKAGLMFTITPSIYNISYQEIVVMVLSAPGNFKQRSKVRQEIRSYQGLDPIFLLGFSNNDTIDKTIKGEALKNNDIVQINVQDGYENLAYKSFAGFLWINRYKSLAKFVLKIDDDVSMFWQTLQTELKNKYKNGIGNDVIECPSVMRNMPPWRPRRSNHETSIMSKWAVTEREMPSRVFPDFCPGWAYVLSPALGVKLAQSAASMTEMKSMKRLDDIFVTGFARQRLEGVKVEQLKGGWSGLLWDEYFSQCPFLGITKNIFFNDFVKAKGTYVNSFAFYMCAYLEFFILDTLDGFYSVPTFLNQICQR